MQKLIFNFGKYFKTDFFYLPSASLYIKKILDAKRLTTSDLL